MKGYFGIEVEENAPLVNSLRRYTDSYKVKTYFHHLTLKFNADTTDPLAEYLDMEVELKSHLACYNEKVMALIVERPFNGSLKDIFDISKFKSKPHITVFTYNGGKPVDSNLLDLQNDYIVRFDEPVLIKGIVEFFPF